MSFFISECSHGFTRASVCAHTHLNLCVQYKTTETHIYQERKTTISISSSWVYLERTNTDESASEREF